MVIACGLWTRDLAATVGVPVPLYAAEHIHVSTEPIEGADDLLPLMRALDGSFYARHHADGLMVGTFEPRGRPRSTDAIPDDWAFGELGPDWEHFATIRGNAERRIPALKEAAFTRYLRAFESFTPDVNFCLGETAEIANLYVAAGFNSQGIIYGPGAGKALAEWIHEGAPTFDASEVDVRRFATSQAQRALPPRADHGSARPPLRDALAEPPGDHGAEHPRVAVVRSAEGRRRLLRRARAVGARDVVRAPRCRARLRLLVRPTELVPERGRGASRRAGGGGALRPQLVREGRGHGSGRVAAPSTGVHQRRGYRCRPARRTRSS